MCGPQKYSKVYMEKSRIQETPTLSTDANSRTDTILGRLRDLPIRTEKRTWSTRKCGLGSRKNADSVHAKVVTRSTQKYWLGSLWNTSLFLGLYSRLRLRWTLEHIPVFRALLEIEIQIQIKIGLFSRPPIRTSPRENADSVHAKKHAWGDK